jgi:DNA-binding NarL/FixJ family response regulator
MKSVHQLTKQESVVLALVARGWRNAHIARELFISTKTVETHLSRIFGKLGVSSRTQAALHAVHSGVLAEVEIGGIPDDSAMTGGYAKT